MAAKLYVIASAATIFYCVGLGIDVIGCVCVYWLYRHNKKARKINTRSTIILSQRYQITENIRLLRILFPIVATGVFVSISGTFLHILSFNIPALFEYFRYSVAMYYLLYNCYCFVSILLYASMDPYYRRQRWCFWQKVESVDVSSRVSERTTTMGQHVPIKNVDGEDVARMPTTDEYFKTIQQQWDVNNTSAKTGK
uniref:G protein-coupled receptor n=1 Tax=Panagrolaimus sp. JU765 TaxID=591449 RepID=A0AC34QAF7_9BILA